MVAYLKINHGCILPHHFNEKTTVVRVVWWIFTDVPDERAASIIIVEES
jgi:hypothetical protein